jgi:hypothetical protein
MEIYAEAMERNLEYRRDDMTWSFPFCLLLHSSPESASP